MNGPRAIVVVPAHNEEARIERCLSALAAQTGLGADEFEILVVLDGCSDGTAKAVGSFAAIRETPRTVSVEGPDRGAGAARAYGMDLACEQLAEQGRSRGLLASTDADSCVAADWLVRQLEAVELGAEALGGLIELDPLEAALLSPQTLRARADELQTRTLAAAARGPSEHPHFSGASLSLTVAAYRRVGGMRPLSALEDEDLERRLAACDIRIHRPLDVRVETSARTHGRASRGLAKDLGLGEWSARRSYLAADYPLQRLIAARERSVSVILPAREVAETIGGIVECLAGLREAGLFDELLVIDASSADGSAEIAAERGARVVDENDVLPEFGPCAGKGDAMWRAASVAEGELLVYLDADSSDFSERFLLGVLGPSLCEPGLELVKGAFRRPFKLGEWELSDGGGRVTELIARPLLNLHFPELAGFGQPLAGEIAIEADLMRQLSVPVGYGAEIAMLIDALRLVGLDSLAQVDLGSRQNRHQPLDALSRMAFQVLAACERRVRAPGFEAPNRYMPRSEDRPEAVRVDCSERPPLVALPGERERLSARQA